jgi:S1-C subfamily serine protease
MGVKGGTLNPTMVEAMNLSVSSGAYISDITPGGPAEKTGLRGTTGQRTVSGRLVEVGGDVITAVDGHPVRNFYDVMVYVALQTTPGQSVAFTIIRDGKEQTFSIVMGVRPEQPEMQPVSLP